MGLHFDGRPFYAMRLIKGESLKDAIAAFHAHKTLRREHAWRSLEMRRLLRRFIDVCAAIEYAHSRGILHRDIKPRNVMLGKYGETMVVDWSLATTLDRSEPGSPDEQSEPPLRPTFRSAFEEEPAGTVCGTPAYMSPEQTDGGPLGPQSDVYNLGATLYCLLTGKPPFEGDVRDILLAVRRGDFRPPRQLDHNIDPALEAICLKAMAHRPEDRYPSCRALADDLDRWLADEPATAWAEPFSRRARRWARRNRSAVTAAAAATLVALAGIATVLAVQTRSHGQLKQANSALADANERLMKANADLRSAHVREK